MKHTKLLILSLIAAMTFSACGTDDSLQFNFPDKENNGGGNTGGDNSGGSTDKNNSNKNMVKANMPQVLKNALGGLEFPKLKDNGTSYAIVHMDGDVVNFSSEWDDDMKSQRWSCYTFNTTNIASHVKRWDAPQGERQYPWDTDLQEQWGITDFTEDPTPTSQGFDHGHICPSADRKLNLTQQKQTFFMTNMQPQYKNFNQRGTWLKMEDELRKLAPKIDSDTLFIVKGGTIDAVGSESNLIGWKKNGASSDVKLPGYIPVPKYFFVAVLKKEFNTKTQSYGYSAFGYWFKHENKAFDSKKDKLGDYVVNIKTLEERTGIDFFCNLPDDIEKQVEEMDVQAIKNIWGFK